MKRIFITWLLISCVCISGIGQQSKTKSDRTFRLISSVGMAAGQSRAMPIFQVIGGVAQKRYFAGFGLGMDYYQFRSMPVFADFRISVLKNNMLFGYADAGYNFPIDIDESESPWFTSNDEYSGSYYMDAGVGCRLPISKKSKFLISFGYSIKRIDRKYSFQSSWRDPSLTSYYDYEYTMRRLLCKLNWEFGR